MNRSKLLVLTAALVFSSAAFAQNPPAQQQPPPSPCKIQPEYRQFDFWAGEWEVRRSGTPPGAVIANNRIEIILEQCALLESWQPLQGPGGKGLHVYNIRLKKWQQLWVMASGNVAQFAGEVRDGMMTYETDFEGPQGRGVRRTRIQALDVDTVRQWSEATTDGGKTWTPVFDFTYTRKK